jgi:hypothetical protein
MTPASTVRCRFTYPDASKRRRSHFKLGVNAYNRTTAAATTMTAMNAQFQSRFSNGSQ